MTPESSPPTKTRDPIAFLNDLIVDKFHDDQDRTYITVLDGNDSESTFPIGSKECHLYIRKAYFEKTKGGLEQRQIDKIMGTLGAKAQFGGRQENACLRVGRTATGGIEIDVGEKSGKVLRIQPETKIELIKPTRKFIRPTGFGEMAFGEGKADFHRIWEFINVESETDRILLSAWCLMTLNPDGPYPLLALQGEQGSAKTTATRMLKALLDPGIGDTRSLPSSEQNLFIAAQRNHLLSFDNLSGMRHEMSDALCRLSTGAAFASRQLYTNGGETLHEAKRPIMLNGIDDLVSKADLASRSVIIHLPVIPPNQRRDEKTLFAEFETTKASIVNGLLVALKAALEKFDDVELKEMPRMADFIKLATAAEGAFGFKEGAVADAFEKRQTDSQLNALDLDPVAIAISKHFKSPDVEAIEGTASEIMDKLNGTRTNNDPWPKTPSHFSQHLSRITPNLRAVDITVERPPRTAMSKSIVISKNWDKIAGVKWNAGTEARAN